MRNSIIIRLFALLLSFAMLTEVSLPIQLVDAVSIEIDSESEHEENNEKENDKTTTNLNSYSCYGFTSIENRLFSGSCDSNWKAPSIDFITPPPELI